MRVYPFYSGMYANAPADVKNVVLIDSTVGASSGLDLIVTGVNGAVKMAIDF
jgi:hypothetical protein